MAFDFAVWFRGTNNCRRRDSGTMHIVPCLRTPFPFILFTSRHKASLSENCRKLDTSSSSRLYCNSSLFPLPRRLFLSFIPSSFLPSTSQEPLPSPLSSFASKTQKKFPVNEPLHLSPHESDRGQSTRGGPYDWWLVSEGVITPHEW